MRDDRDHGSDQRITEAYEQLRVALAPPPDVLVGVERRIGARRRRRRTALAGAAALVLGGAVTGAVVLGSGDRAADRVPTNPPDVHPVEHGGSFTLTGPDGSEVVIDDLTLSCDHSPAGQPAEPGHIYLWSPVRLTASGDRLAKPYVSFDAVAQQADGKDYTLPVDNADGGSRHVLLYAAETGDGSNKQANEVSSAAGGATGTIRVVHASCEPTPTLELEVDTTLGSEVDQGTLDVTGSYR